MSFNPMSIIRKFDAGLADDYEQFAEALFQDGALSKKVKLLAALALDAIKGSANGVQFFTQEALNAGATWARSAKYYGSPII